MMKQATVFVLLAALCLAAIPDASAFTRHSLYQYAKLADCTALFKFRAAFFKLNCKGCKATLVMWNGAGIGYDSKKDFNCLILGNYPNNKKLFDAYQVKEKANKVYSAIRGRAKLNANFMAKSP